MKRLTITIWLALLVGGATAVAADSAVATNLCVGAGSGCYSTLQAAVDAAHSGDTIRVGRGTFAGGVQIDESVKLVGAGARSDDYRRRRPGADDRHFRRCERADRDD